jgi:hypothetical protein
MSTNPSFNSVKAQKSYVFVSSHICCSCRSDQGGGTRSWSVVLGSERPDPVHPRSKPQQIHQHKQIASADNWGMNEKEEEGPEPVDQWWL